MKRIALFIFSVFVLSTHLACMEKDSTPPIEQNEAALLKLEKIDTSTELIQTLTGMVKGNQQERTTLVNILRARARMLECFLSENLAKAVGLDISAFDHIINDQLKQEERNLSKLSPLSKFFLNQLDELLVKENSKLTMKNFQVYMQGRKKAQKIFVKNGNDYISLFDKYENVEKVIDHLIQNNADDQKLKDLKIKVCNQISFTIPLTFFKDKFENLKEKIYLEVHTNLIKELEKNTHFSNYEN